MAPLVEHTDVGPKVWRSDVFPQSTSTGIVAGCRSSTKLILAQRTGTFGVRKTGVPREQIQKNWSLGVSHSNNLWPFQEATLEVPTICKA